MSLSQDKKIDILTFAETEQKPFALASGALAFECFMPHLEALVLDAIYNILKFSDQKQSIKQLLSREESFDPVYANKVFAACKRFRLQCEQKQKVEGEEDEAETDWSIIRSTEVEEENKVPNERTEAETTVES